MAGLQDLQSFLDGQAGGDDEDRLGKFPAFGESDSIQHLPGDEHGHDRRFAGAGRHFAAHPFPGAVIAGYRDALPVVGRTLHPPDQGFHGFQLAEVERQVAGGAVLPMFQQAAGDGGDARIVGGAPFRNPLANRVDQG